MMHCANNAPHSQLKVVADKEVEVAKQCLAQGNKKKALISLKKKKYQEQLLEKTDAQLLNLEELVSFVLIGGVQRHTTNKEPPGRRIP